MFLKWILIHLRQWQLLMLRMSIWKLMRMKKRLQLQHTVKHNLLNQFKSCGDSAMEDMAGKMQSKFSKYWDDYSLTLAMGAVLDPKLKTQILKSAYDKVDAIVKKNLKLLYEEYRTNSWTSSTISARSTAHELLTESPLEDDPNYDLFELERSIQPGLDNTKSNWIFIWRNPG
ncbi:uncharacterized protein LOC112082235 isoform X2 [Eutrema salsugineum]|uniref:uncharacterized protein LOC112082235 isoform X2 n=1 Tax=Eutrema salsugineum TaxID=72664 RepID=UPI000CED414B|nr:uncharacterized protein LOC112082235 isoform X2 [Eutrema salsugineum]